MQSSDLNETWYGATKGKPAVLVPELVGVWGGQNHLKGQDNETVWWSTLAANSGGQLWGGSTPMVNSGAQLSNTTISAVVRMPGGNADKKGRVDRRS